MVQLALSGSSGRGAVKEIPKAAGAAVVAPMRNRRHVAKDRIQSDLSLVVVTEIFGDAIYLFLACGIPRHFTPKRHGTAAPVFGASLQLSFHRGCLLSPILAFEILEQEQEDCAVHEAIATVSDVGMGAEIV